MKEIEEFMKDSSESLSENKRNQESAMSWNPGERSCVEQRPIKEEENEKR